MGTDTTERPAWMTTEFLEETLRSRDCFANSKVLDSAVHSAVGKGENYSSIVYRVDVKLKRDEDSSEVEETGLIIKTLSSVEFVAKFVIESKSFEREMIMTSITIPAMDKLLRESHPGKKLLPLSAHCYKSSEPQTLILEDLTRLGYKKAERKSQLDLLHSTVVLKSLARFHAASVTLNEGNPEVLEFFKSETMYNERNRKVMTGFTDQSMNALINVVGKWPGFEKYTEKIRAVIPVAYDRLMELVKPKPNAFNVLNHGDCWVTNMLFHYSAETGEVDGVGFVDFQLSRFSSPALDLQYFIYSSPTKEVRSKKADYLLEIYHRELTETLKCLGQDPNQFTLDQLKQEFDEKAFFGFIVSCSVLTAVLAETSEVMDIENIKEDGSIDDNVGVEKPFSGNRFKEVFQNLLPHFESKGVI